MTQSKDTLNGLSHLTSQNDLKWHHIPPRTPHFGGLWEAGVKSMKLLLRKTLTPHPLCYEELYMALVEVEAILNSRPLSPLHADDLKEVAFLTPGHFLIGRALKSPPTALPPSSKITSLRPPYAIFANFYTTAPTCASSQSDRPIGTGDWIACSI